MNPFRHPLLRRACYAGLLCLALVVVWLGRPGALTAAVMPGPAVQSGGPLRVVTKPIEPFVIKQGDHWTGFSIDLWDEIARRLGVSYEWVEVKTVTDQLNAVEQGQADIAIAGISMTADREKLVDFSHPYFDAGLQILTKQNSRPSLYQHFMRFFTPSLLTLLAVGLLFSLVMGHVIWLFERRHNPDFPRGYVRGVTEGLWWLYTVIATGEYPDKEHSNQVKRGLTVVWWLLGVALVAQLTGTIASSLTVEQLTAAVNGPGDLPGRQVAAVNGSTAAQYLTEQGISFEGVTRIDDAYALLQSGEVQAVVYDAPVLQYYAAKKARGQMQVVGPIFKPEKYGIALPSGSPWRKQINETLLAIYQDGTYEALYNEWFGAPS